MSGYDFSRNHLTARGVKVVGFGSGDDAIQLTHPDPRVVHNVMVDGHVVAAAQLSRQGVWTIKLRHNSSSNSLLRTQANLKSVFPVRWTEPDGTVHFSQNTRVSKVPDRSAGANVGEKTWELLGEEVFTTEGPGVTA
jgi:hypothetical protein